MKSAHVVWQLTKMKCSLRLTLRLKRKYAINIVDLMGSFMFLTFGTRGMLIARDQEIPLPPSFMGI